MKYLLAVALLAGVSSEMLAQEGNAEKTDSESPLYTHRQLSADNESSVLPIRISQPLFLVKYDLVAEEVTKPEFEDLTRNATRNVEYIKVLKDSELLDRYGYKDRNSVVILALKSKPVYSEEFLNRKRNSSTN